MYSIAGFFTLSLHSHLVFLFQHILSCGKVFHGHGTPEEQMCELLDECGMYFKQSSADGTRLVVNCNQY